MCVGGVAFDVWVGDVGLGPWPAPADVPPWSDGPCIVVAAAGLEVRPFCAESGCAEAMTAAETAEAMNTFVMVVSSWSQSVRLQEANHVPGHPRNGS